MADSCLWVGISMSEVLKITDATARKTTEAKLRDALAHEGHKTVSDALGISSSNISKYLSGDQTTSLERFCAMIDAAGLKLVDADEFSVDPAEYKNMAKICAAHFGRIAGQP